MDEGQEEEEEEEAYYDGSGTGFYKYTGGDGAAAQRLENIMLALELPEVSSMRRLKKGSKGYRAAKRYRLVYANSGKRGQWGANFHKEVIIRGDSLKAWQLLRPPEEPTQGQQLWTKVYSQTLNHCIHW